MLLRPLPDDSPKKGKRIFVIWALVVLCLLVAALLGLYLVDITPESEQRIIPLELDISSSSLLRVQNA